MALRGAGLQVLVMGGTRFVGRAVVEACLARGHHVTLFNRGVHGADLFPDVEKLRGDRNSDLGALQGRHFDAVVDTFGFLPSSIEAIGAALEGTSHYTFVSSQAVYSDVNAVGLDETAAVRTASPEEQAEALAVEVVAEPGQAYGPLYGPLKAACELTVEQTFGAESTFVVRPGRVVGPYDFGGDRFTYWASRVARGGRVLAPGHPDDPLQIIDVRDLAMWIAASAEDRRVGTYNATGPATPLTMGQFLETCATVTGSQADLVWVTTEQLLAAGVRPYVDLPLWTGVRSRSLFTVDNRRAVGAGLEFRSLEDTIRDAWHWARAEGIPDRWDPRRETELSALAREE